MVARRAVEVRQQFAASSPLICGDPWLFIVPRNPSLNRQELTFEWVYVYYVHDVYICLPFIYTCFEFVETRRWYYYLIVYVAYVTSRQSNELCQPFFFVFNHLNLFCQRLDDVGALPFSWFLELTIDFGNLNWS